MKVCSFFSVPESEIIAVRKSLYVLVIWYQKDCKTICLFGLFWGHLLWKGGWAEKKSLQFTKRWVNVSPHSALWHWCVRQGRGGSLEQALLQLPPDVSHLLPSHRLAMGEWMVPGKSEKQAKILCNLSRDGLTLQQLPLSSVKHTDGRISKAEGKLRLFRTEIFFCYFETIIFQ